MGLYTEMILGASLKKETPKNVIDLLLYMTNPITNKPTDLLFEPLNLLIGGSYYFGVNIPVNKMWFDEIDNRWHISCRTNSKNKNNEMQSFIEWIKPFIESGSGENEIFAMLIREESEFPILYTLY